MTAQVKVDEAGLIISVTRVQDLPVVTLQVGDQPSLHLRCYEALDLAQALQEAAGV